MLNELGKAASQGTIFSLISKGVSHFSDIKSKDAIPSPLPLINTLKRLVDLEVVAKNRPINAKDDNKKTQYIISDPMAKFSFTYLFPNLSSLEIMNQEAFYKAYTEKDFQKRYIPFAFEGLCHDFLVRENLNGKSDPPFLEIGKYWYDLPKERKNGEFDLVARNEHGYSFLNVNTSVNLVAMKWSKKRNKSRARVFL